MTADGEARHYLGPSSVFSFSHVIHASLRQPFPGSHLESLDDHQDDAAAAPSPCFLPDYELGISLSNAYFENIHPHYPFLHEPTFRRWEDALVRPSNTIGELDFDPVPLFFVNMVPTPSTRPPDVMTERSRFMLLGPCCCQTQDHCRR